MSRSRPADEVATSRARARRLAALTCAVLLAGCSGGPTPTPIPPQATPTPTISIATPTTAPTVVPPTPTPTSAGSVALALHTVATGLHSPLFLADAGDVAGRLYVVEQGGRIRVLENGTLRGEPFLDISKRLVSGGERGLLSVAFAPDYAQSGRLWVDYTNLDGDTVIERFTRSADGLSADAASGHVLLTIDQPFANHNGGLVMFGPDGYFYVGMGDGGSGGDPQGNGQSGSTLLGKLLRLDVSGTGYTVPADNPFVGDPDVRDEIWALGLRNPWRFSFDRQTGDLWIGDVGQGRWEEVDFQPGLSKGGENYGWARMEGPDCYNGPCDPADYVLPVTAYKHGEGDCTVIGGYVYRGSTIAELRGTYLFGDYCSGRLWGLDAVAAASRTAQPALLLATGLTLSSFGEDLGGELYVTDPSGGVYQVVRAP